MDLWNIRFLDYIKNWITKKRNQVKQSDNKRHNEWTDKFNLHGFSKWISSENKIRATVLQSLYMVCPSENYVENTLAKSKAKYQNSPYFFQMLIM